MALLSAFWARNEARGCLFEPALKAHAATVEAYLLENKLLDQTVLACQRPGTVPQSCVWIWTPLHSGDALFLTVHTDRCVLNVNGMAFTVQGSDPDTFDSVIGSFLKRYRNVEQSMEKK
jgi:hypothetical protein